MGRVDRILCRLSSAFSSRQGQGSRVQGTLSFEKFVEHCGQEGLSATRRVRAIPPRGVCGVSGYRSTKADGASKLRFANRKAKCRVGVF